MTALPASSPRVAAPPALAASPWLIRLFAFVALGLFAGAHWAHIVRPAADGDLLVMLLLALAAGVLFSAALQAGGRLRRVVLSAAVVAGAVAAILLAAHVPAATLRPDRWDELVTGIAGALESLPALRIPYRGFDPWIRGTLLLGGGLLLLAAACLVLAPRPRTFAAAVCLGLLYVVPIVERGPSHPYLDGLAFALLLGFLLWADRMQQHEAPIAAGLALTVVLVAAIAAPHLDSRNPWIDYEAIAESLQAGKSTSFTWNQRYGPIDWPRDGLELARVRTRGDLYLKTADLERFEHGSWRQSHDVLRTDEDTPLSVRHPEWTQVIHVSIKGLKSRQFVGAGTTLYINNASRQPVEATPGTFESAGKPLRRGNSYDATVYVPKPSPTELHDAGTDYPGYVSRQLNLDLPATLGPQVGAIEVSFAAWGSGRLTAARGANGFVEINPAEALRESQYGRSYALAQQLRTASLDPYDYVRNVIARVQRGARYTESPPAPRPGEAPLEAFLFRDRAGYCQYFAGATALLLRMGGVPARVATGFSPGSRDGGDHIIRDLDAHAWVEVYFPRLGWVTFDPTPADSPARSQLTDTLRAPGAAPGDRRQPTAAGDRVSDPTAGGLAGTGGAEGSDPTALLVAAGIAAVLLVAGVALWLRRRRRLARSDDPELEELRIALTRTGRPPGNAMTLWRLERLLGSSEGALGYLQSLRLARYGSGAPPPTAAQRRALRRALVAGLGLRAHLTAVWALPPQPRELLDALRPRRRRPYTGSP